MSQDQPHHAGAQHTGAAQPAAQPPTLVSCDRVSVVFGNRPDAALPLMDAGQTREEISAQTGQVLGVHDCSLDVAAGEIVVLMGLSGSGKSTLLRAVNGLNPVTRGALRVAMTGGAAPDLIDVGTCDARTLRKLRAERVAMVFQQFALLPWRSVRDNVALGLELAGMPAAERRQRADEQLELVNLETWADRPVQELSGGMQQRVGLARAFATQAPILLMDEPFSALDPLIRTKLQDELLQLQRQLDRTIIFVSHDLDEAMKLGSRIAIMEGGRIVQLGTPQDIVLRPATPYVADFVAHINPLNVLRAVEVMRPLEGAAVPPRAIPVPVTTPLGDLITARLARPDTLVVTDGDVPVGTIEDSDIMRALVRRAD